MSLEALLAEIDAVRRQALAELEGIDDPEGLRAWEKGYLGKKGALGAFLARIPTLPPEARPALGRAVNQAQQALREALEARRPVVEAAALQARLEAERVDVTLPGRWVPEGVEHLIHRTLWEVVDLFRELGFQVVLGPELESDEMNFQLLNIPPDHPAREMQDTFYVDAPGGPWVLRTHTSPGQIRAMRRFAPEPMRVVIPGKVYRHEDVTPRSEMMFHQVEALAVGENVRMTDLKGVLWEISRRFFGPDVKVRMRGSYFPFTEPSVEVDVTCFLCDGQGCRVCKGLGWLEMLGAGMIHPVVLRNGGYDPEKVSGFALGMGVERIAMLRHGIEDIRHFYGNDLRFLEQFR